jgi:hypothetical protein
MGAWYDANVPKEARAKGVRSKRVTQRPRSVANSNEATGKLLPYTVIRGQAVTIPLEFKHRYKLSGNKGVLKPGLEHPDEVLRSKQRISESDRERDQEPTGELLEHIRAVNERKIEARKKAARERYFKRFPNLRPKTETADAEL